MIKKETQFPQRNTTGPKKLYNECKKTQKLAKKTKKPKEVKKDQKRD